VFGTKGELTGDGSKIRHFDFQTRSYREYQPREPPTTSKLRGHGGADYFLIQGFVRAVHENNSNYILTDAKESLQSHLMVFAAEESRKTNTIVTVDDLA